jgi:hypothetical protein
MPFRQHVNDEVLASATMTHGKVRGLVLELTPDQVVNRLLYLAGKASSAVLDPWVRNPEPNCPTIFYRLKGYNGGKDPTASDPATRWREVGKQFINVTSDCVGGVAWASGFDRYQPTRFAHIYEGWINTDSMRQDAKRVIVPGSPRRCFERIDVPEPGCMIVFGSGAGGHEVGHVGGVVAFNGVEWDPNERDCWKLISVVDVAGRKGRANLQTTGVGWYRTDAWFLRSVMPASA